VSKTLEGLRRQITGAKDLRSVVHTMKVIAASNITQFERAANGSADAFATLELGLVACLHGAASDAGPPSTSAHKDAACAIVFGTDQGLVGRFNESLADTVAGWANERTGPVQLFAVGRRLAEALGGIETPKKIYAAANSLGAIADIVGQVVLDVGPSRDAGSIGEVWVFHNRPREGEGYEPASQRMLPLDREWQGALAARPWPTKVLPEVIEGPTTLTNLVSEYLYLSLFRACAESLASENAGRLIAMERAEKNIRDLLDRQVSELNRLRQDSIDEELFDVVAGFEAQLTRTRHPPFSARTSQEGRRRSQSPTKKPE
jgi:F-type H+-transporting ATPase subunit gamma